MSEEVHIDSIAVWERFRKSPPDRERVARLANSFEAVGQLQPIRVSSGNRLIFGLHRLEAAKVLGWTTIDAEIVEAEEIDQRLMEISENLHRADLTALERDEHVAEWIRLTEAKFQSSPEPESDKLSQSATVSKGGRGNEGGIRAAARELGIDKDDAHRAAKVAGLSDEAKEAAREVGLDDNRSALLDAAKEKDPEKQVEKIHNHRAQGTGDNEWYTPAEHIEAARKVLGAIDLDPATSEFAQGRVKAKKFYTQENDGLTQEWAGRVWLNPPYAQPFIAQFASKMAREVAAGNVTAAIMLTHNYTDTAWFHELFSACSAICFTRGRVKFEKSDGSVAAPTQGQAFFYFGKDVKSFRRVFGGIGFVVTP
jgi:phage N-6-adenine-methyltransferase